MKTLRCRSVVVLNTTQYLCETKNAQCLSAAKIEGCMPALKQQLIVTSDTSDMLLAVEITEFFVSQINRKPKKVLTNKILHIFLQDQCGSAMMLAVSVGALIGGDQKIELYQHSCQQFLLVNLFEAAGSRAWNQGFVDHSSMLKY